MLRDVSKLDPEYRFEMAVCQGGLPSFRPELGPCLLYLGADNGKGYGQFGYNGKNGYAHRYAWERINGPIPEGMTVDHLCRVRNCVNTAHMELVDGPENTRRGAAARPRMTHCSKRGHDIAVVGLRNGECRECAAIRDRERRARLRKGPPGMDSRVKYDQELKRLLIERAAKREITVRQAAEELGCSVKYMDKLVRRVRRGNE